MRLAPLIAAISAATLSASSTAAPGDNPPPGLLAKITIPTQPNQKGGSEKQIDVLAYYWGSSLPAPSGDPDRPIIAGTVPNPRDSASGQATGKRQLENGMYLSEIPGSINVAVDGTRQPQLDPTVHRMIDPWSNTRSGGSRPQYAGWGGAQAHTTPYGQSLQVAGQVFESGLGVLSNSRLQVKNDGGHARLIAAVGVDDSTDDTRQPVRFYVYGDGKLLAESPPMAFGSKAHPLQADIRGIKVVELVVRGSPSKNAPSVVATWGDARLTGAATAGR